MQRLKHNLADRHDRSEFVPSPSCCWMSGVNQQRVSHSFCRAPRSFQIRSPTSLTLVPTSFALVPNSPPTSLTLVPTSFALAPDSQLRQPPCSASTTTRSKGKELNGAPLPCLPCFCSVSCAQSMTFCSTLKGCASHRCHCAKGNVQCTIMACGWCVWLKHIFKNVFAEHKN